VAFIDIGGRVRVLKIKLPETLSFCFFLLIQLNEKCKGLNLFFEMKKSGIFVGNAEF